MAPEAPAGYMRVSGVSASGRPLRPSRWRKVVVLTLCGAGAGLLNAVQAGSPPPLPTPCANGACNAGTTPVPSFASFGAASAATKGNTLTVTQSTSSAILNWANFNIASGYSVNFVQPSSTAAALNNIWSANPSTIAGKLTANGQIYLYNQNGIVFSQGAQVNVGALVATSLGLSPDLFENGILSGGPGSLVFANCAGAGASCTTPAAGGPISVGSGAVLTAADGGRIMLLGSAVTNQGTITTPDGQAILGAGNGVYLAASSDPALRGLLIEVGTGAGAGGTVSNAGTISAPRGNVTLAGLIVNQAGTVSATTSVSANGSIYLVAGDDSSFSNQFLGFGQLLPSEGGTVTLAPGSVTEVLPDTTDTSTITRQNLDNFLPSQVNVVGQDVYLVGNAAIRAPSGSVQVFAAANPGAQQLGTSDSSDGGRIYLDSGSTIDVSGLANVQVPATQDIIQVTLEGNDLADDPLLRSGFLHGQAVTVNASQGSTLFNVAPYAQNISEGIDQVLTAAGSIALNSDGDVIARSGSTLNVSGGSIAYQGATGPATTELMAANGQAYSISTAPTNLQYVSVANGYSYTDQTWGTQSSYSGQAYYPGYLQGANAGSLKVVGNQIYLRGSMLAATEAGPYQRQLDSLPLGGEFQIGCGGCQASDAATIDMGAPSVVLGAALPDALGADFNYSSTAATLPLPLQEQTTISPAALAQAGFNQLKIYSGGDVELPAGTTAALAAGGSLVIQSDVSINLDGNISIPGGTVSLTTRTAVPPSAGADPNPHNIAVGPGVVIDVGGNWTNDLPQVNSGPTTSAIAYAGGAISMTAYGDLSIGQGATLDASGGGWLSSTGQLTAGAAGSIALGTSFLQQGEGAVQLGSGVVFAADSLKSGGGGSLSLTSGSVTLGSQALGTPGELLLNPAFFDHQGFSAYSITGQDDLVIGSTPASPTGGGSGASVPTLINPIQDTLVFTGNDRNEPTGTPLADFAALQVLPAPQRSPVKLTFAANGTLSSSTATKVGPDVPGSGYILLNPDTSILVDPRSSVTLDASSSTGSIAVLGSITAPAGSISLQLEGSNYAENPGGLGYLAGQEILLGPSAVLDAAAYLLSNTLNPYGYQEGSVLGGGSISLQANKGFVVTEPGSVIDVNGTAATLDTITSAGVTPTLVAGAAGSVAIDAREGLVLQGALLGAPATSGGTVVSGAAGGSLTVGLDLFDYSTTANENGANQPPDPYPLALRTLTLSGEPASALPDSLQSGTALISAPALEAGGFDNITLKSADIIAVQGTVNLSARASLTLDAPLLQGNAGSSLRLSAPYVALGDYYNDDGAAGLAGGSITDDYFNTVNGPGTAFLNPNAAAVLSPGCGSGSCSATLAVNADLIDVRGISGWAGFSTETLDSSGDIRFVTQENPIAMPADLGAPAEDTSYAPLRSALGVSGVLTLTAQQLYPATSTDFTLNSGALVSILPASGTPDPVLSAGGSLTINAAVISQGGTLRAPLGQITLNASAVTLAPGSVTDVSADGNDILYGSTLNGQQWNYSPDSQITNVVSALPQKAVNLTGASVTIDKGATVNLSGGGDLTAYEWIQGPGGSTDVLDPGSAVNQAGVLPYQYAIVPALSSTSASVFGAVDQQLSWQQGSGTLATTPNATAQDIYLSGVPGLAAGYYALLPARYALLPGAYGIRIMQSGSGIAAGSVVDESNGSYLVAGQLAVAGTSILDSRTSTVLVAPSSVVNNQSDYTLTSANGFFSSTAVGSAAPGAAAAGIVATLPADAGALNIAASASVQLSGSMDFGVGSYTVTGSSGKATTVSGAGGTVSIQAPDIEVVDAGTPAAAVVSGALQLDAGQLNALGAQTLVLGGTEQPIAGGAELTAATTQNITLANATVALQGPDIVLAAQDAITVDADAQISAKGAAATAASAGLVLNGAGAVLQASTAPLPAVAIESSTAADYIAQNPAGVLSIGSNASLAASGSLLLYSSGTTTAGTGDAITSPALGLYSSQVSVGQVPTAAAAPTGLDLSPQLLSSLGSLTGLTIGSSSSIDFYGGVSLGSPVLQALVLDTPAVYGHDAGATAGNVTLQAGAITLENTFGTAAPAAAGPGTGALVISATTAGSGSGQITLGGGSQLLDGFAGGVTFAAAGAVLAQGTGTLNVGSAATPTNLSLGATELTAAGASDQAIAATGTVTITSTGAASSTPPLGGDLSITGSAIVQNGAISLPGGVLSLHATGTGGIQLGASSLTSVAGTDESFYVTAAAAPGGTLDLTADAGSITLAKGATVDISGASASNGGAASAAGSLDVEVPNGSFGYSGATLRGAAPIGQAQGNFSLDAQSGLGGGGLSGLLGTLTADGFTGALDVRSRGDSTLILGTNVMASSFTLTADVGSIDITGTVNTSGGISSAAGGSISIWAGDDLTLGAGASLLAAATGAGPAAVNGEGLPSSGGNITLGITRGTIDLLPGSTIDLRGSTAASDGSLTLRAPATQGTDTAPEGATDLPGSDVAITAIGSTVKGVNPVIVEAYNVYDISASGTLSATTGDAPAAGAVQVGTTGSGAPIYSAYATLAIGTPGGDAGVLFNNASALALVSPGIGSRLAQSNPALAVQVRPGIEIDGSGDVQVGDAGTTGQVWDLDAWNTALGAPVNLSLRAAGNLVFNASLSDGFTNNGKAVSNWVFGESGAGTVGPSASYILTGGADLASANPLAVIPQPLDAADDIPDSGNVIVTPGTPAATLGKPGNSTVIRTGSGSIDIASGGDLLLGYAFNGDSGGSLQVAETDPLDAAIYTAGVPVILTAAQSAQFTPTKVNQFNPYTPAYGTGGGALSITAADDLRSAISAQVPSDWQWRRGALNPDGSLASLTSNPSWWIVPAYFDQGVGALGGGNVFLAAGNNIINVSAVIPTTGMLLGAPETQPAYSNLLLNGGGYLSVRAGGNIGSGIFENDWGNTSIVAGGGLISAATLGQMVPAQDLSEAPFVAWSSPVYPIALLGTGDFDIAARTGATLNYVGNSTVLPEAEVNTSALRGANSYFYTYAPSTAFNLESAGGDVALLSSLANLPASVLTGGDLPQLYDDNGGNILIYPPNLNLAALGGNISILNGGVTMFPSASGNLSLLAEDSITGDLAHTITSSFQVTMAESKPSLWASVLNPESTVTALIDDSVATELPAVPLHQGDAQPIYMVAATGDISESSLQLPKAADIIAGGDIYQLSYSGKNLNPFDVTLIEAGDELLYSTPTAPVTDALQVNGAGITVGGGGYVDVLAGGSINLGDSAGIVTTGSLDDARLASGGASLVIGAGFGTLPLGGLRQPDYSGFIGTYLPSGSGGGGSTYAADLTAYMQQLFPADAGIGYAAALAQFQALPSAQQLPLLSQILLAELNTTGLDHTLHGDPYTRGFDAIDALFPAKDAQGNALTYQGDVDMFFSQIKTEQGGSIGILAPGGSVEVGVTNPPSALNGLKGSNTPPIVSPAANLGLLVLGAGAIEGFADNSWNVNTSRILTLEGGDIILWASQGNIDAGKGAKSASGAPPPVIETDAQGNVFVNPVNDVAGSGIGQLLSGPGETAGLVDLIAPNGAVNAGDAGIRVAGNLNIAAVQVIGANNIQVGGTATGVPASEAGALSGALSGASSLGDASKNAVDQLTQDLTSAASLDQLTESLAPTFVQVKMFCLGVECQVQ